MDKDLLSLILMLVATVVMVIGIAVAWGFATRLRRGFTMTLLLTAFLAVSFQLIGWATSEGGVSGVYTAVMSWLLIPVVTLFAIVSIIVAAFTSWGSHGRKTHPALMWIILGVLAIMMVGLSFQESIRTGLSRGDLNDPDPAVRVEALLALGELGDTSYVTEIVEMLKDSVAEVRLQAVWALFALGDSTTAPAVRGMLADQYPDVRSAAIYTCTFLGETLSVQELMSFLGDPDYGVREAAAIKLDQTDPNWRNRPETPEVFREKPDAPDYIDQRD